MRRRVEICFPDQESRALYSCKSNLVAAFGDALARLICCRLAVLRAAPNLLHLPTHPPIGLAHENVSKGTFFVRLGKVHRLVFRAPDAPPQVDRSTVTRVEILDLIPNPSAKG